MQRIRTEGWCAMMRGIGFLPSRAKSVLLKSSWAVVIEREGNEGIGFDRCITLLLLANRRTWLRWYVSPIRWGFSALCSLPPLVYKSEKNTEFQGPKACKTLEITVFFVIQ